MRIKVSDISNTEMNKICKNHYSKYCKDCPLKRFSKDGREIQCFKRVRAWHYKDYVWYKENYIGTQEEKEERCEQVKNDLYKIEDIEIEIGETEL